MRRTLRIVPIAAFLGAVVALSFAATAPAAEPAAPPTLWQVPGSGAADGEGAGEISRPNALAADPTDGHVFLVDRSNARIDEFTAWGEFVKAFGWSVDADAPSNQLQTCTTETGCKAGSEGSGEGQFSAPVAISIDSARHIYVGEEQTHRIQVFDQEGAFLFMIGGKVNKTKVEAAAPIADQNRCPVDPGDVCQTGQPGTGPGEFSLKAFGAGVGGEQFEPSSYLAVGPGDTLYVGDVGRIQKFDQHGVFESEISAPSVTGKRVSGLAVDATGNVYVSLRAGGTSETGTYSLLKLGPGGEVLFTYALPVNPQKGLTQPSAGALALGNGGELYAVADMEVESVAGDRRHQSRIIEYDAAGGKLLPTEAEEEAEAEEPPKEPYPFGQVELTPRYENTIYMSGLATSSACGLAADDIYASYHATVHFRTSSLLRAYGPQPDPAVCPRPESPPDITDQFASSVGTEQAFLQARINSQSSPSTTYFVEYGLGKCSEAGCQEKQPVAPAALNSGTNLPVLTAAIPLPGLTPRTTYHFRFVAATRFEGGTEEAVVRGVGGKPGLDGSEGTFTTREPPLPPRTDCPDQLFRIGLSALLTDCRTYEMVSPVEKAGADVVAVNAVVPEVPARIDQAAVSGEALTFSTYRAFANPTAGPFSSQFISRRGGGGWSTESISPGRGAPLQTILETGDTEYQTFSSDLCQGWLRLPFTADPPLDPRELRGLPNLFRRENCAPQAGAYEDLTTVKPPHLTDPTDFNPQVQGISADGQCTVFGAPEALTPEAPVLPSASTEQIVYENCDGTLRLVAVLPNGGPAQSPSNAGTGNSQESLAQYQLRGPTNFSAVSRNGTSIYWTAHVSGENPGTIYRRINADRPQSTVASGECIEPEKACTIPVSQLAGSGVARFWTASSDGARAFFSIGEVLYEYAAPDPFEPEVSLVATGVKEPGGMLGASEDASRIYFASSKVLAPGAILGRPNLYFLEVGEKPRLIGILDLNDLADQESKPISYEPGYRTARVSPDGLQAAFMSSAPLTGFDNIDQRNGEADRELFVYDAAADGGQGRLLCVSCDPTGARPLAQNVIFSQSAQPVWAAARIPTWTTSLYPGNPLTGEGGTTRLFFDSFVPLSPRDTNGHADVYEWENAGGKAACEEDGAETYVPAMAGCLSLISSGQGVQDSEFLDADPAGKNVFFATAASLLPQDPGSIDIYDAREGGGFPAVQAQPPCEGEACQPAGPAPPVSAPASDVARQGNPKHARPCPKGSRRVKRKGGRTACVAKKQRHRRKRPRQDHGHKRQHAKPKSAGKSPDAGEKGKYR